MRGLADRGMRVLARLLVHVFFRRIELQNGDRLPATGPVVLVANHLNGLVDGSCSWPRLGRYPEFLGKSTLFKILPLWPFLKFAGVIPVYRVIDGAPGPQCLAFATCHKILAGGGMVALSPRASATTSRRSQPLRTGAARMPSKPGPRRHGRSGDAWPSADLRRQGATFVPRPGAGGRAVSISRWTESEPSEGRDAVRQFTDDVAQQLTTVSPAYASWERVERLSRVGRGGATARGSVDPPTSPWPTGRCDRAARRSRGGRRRRTEVSEAPGDLRGLRRDLELLGLERRPSGGQVPQGNFGRRCRGRAQGGGGTAPRRPSVSSCMSCRTRS